MATSLRRATVGLGPEVAQRLRELLPRRADLDSIRRDPVRDLAAGLTVAVVALPLALAFGITSGLGAHAGLVTAIVAGFIAATFGGSDLQVSGPTGAMTVILVPIFASFGASGVLAVGMIAGLIRIGLAYGRAGRWMRYVPLPVVEGFTVGIAVVIALQQVPAFLGVPGAGGTVLGNAAAALATWTATPDVISVGLAGAVAVAMLLGARYLPRVPVSLAAVAVATAVATVTDLPIATIGAIPAGLPAPAFPVGDLGRFSGLVLPAIAVAALAALESLMCATVADGMRVGERHDPDRELFGQGLANLVAPLFGGVPATAAIARTAVNVRSGARSRLAAATHAVVLLAIGLVAAGLVARIPVAALAGVLVATAIQMVEVSSLAAIARSTRGDALVLCVTALATVALDLVTAVIVGFVVAGAYALRQLAGSAHLDEIDLDHSDHEAEERRLFEERIVAYRLDGPLFFGAAHAFLLELSEVSDVRVVILRLSRIVTLDATGASVLADTIRRLEARGITVLLSGIRADHRPVFELLGVIAEVSGDRHVFGSTPEAIAHARLHVQGRAHELDATERADEGAAPA